MILPLRDELELELELETQPAIICPVECEVCSEPGDCEDCIDCLAWPHVVEEPSAQPTTRGPADPTKTGDLQAERAQLVIGRRIGLLSRQFRRRKCLTQRELAAELGWSRASVGRMETDASVLPFGKVTTLLEHIGCRLALVTEDDSRRVVGEVPDEVWGAADLLARDAAGRRPPPASQVTWNPTTDRRLYTSLHDREWTWQRPRGPITPPVR